MSDTTHTSTHQTYTTSSWMGVVVMSCLCVSAPAFAQNQTSTPTTTPSKTAPNSTQSCGAAITAKKPRKLTVPKPPKKRMSACGFLPNEAINAVVRQHAAIMKRCLTAQRISRAFTLKFTITKDGNTQGIDVLTTNATSSPATACLAAVVKTWRFPKPPGGRQDVVYPIRLDANPRTRAHTASTKNLPKPK